MQDFRKRPNGRVSCRRMLGGCAVILGLLMLAFFCVRAAWGMYGKFTIASAADEQAQEQYADLKQQEVQVTQDVQEVSTPEGVEGQIRERWGLARPGEGEIDIVDQQSTTTPTALKGESFWAELWHAISVW